MTAINGKTVPSYVDFLQEHELEHFGYSSLDELGPMLRLLSNELLGVGYDYDEELIEKLTEEEYQEYWVKSLYSSKEPFRSIVSRWASCQYHLHGNLECYCADCKLITTHFMSF